MEMVVKHQEIPSKHVSYILVQSWLKFSYNYMVPVTGTFNKYRFV